MQSIAEAPSGQVLDEGERLAWQSEGAWQVYCSLVDFDDKDANGDPRPLPGIGSAQVAESLQRFSAAFDSHLAFRLARAPRYKPTLGQSIAYGKVLRGEPGWTKRFDDLDCHLLEMAVDIEVALWNLEESGAFDRYGDERVWESVWDADGTHHEGDAAAALYAEYVREHPIDEDGWLKLAEAAELVQSMKPAQPEQRQPTSEATAQPAGTVAYRKLTFSELMAGEYPQEYLVNGVVTEAQCGIISGRHKCLKTSIAFDLFMSMASGLAFLGHFQVPKPVRCMIMSAESGLAAIKTQVQRVAVAKTRDPQWTERGLDDSAFHNLIVSPDCPKLTRLEHLNAIERTIVENELKCLAIDPTYLALPGVGSSSSNVFDMGAILEPITRLIERTGCTVILTNHNRKGRGAEIGKFDPPELSEIAMAGFAEWARFWLLLAARKEWDEEIKQHWLHMLTGGSAGHAGLWGVDVIEANWSVTVHSKRDARAVDESRRESDKEHEKTKQLTLRMQEMRDFLLKKHGSPATKSDISTGMGMSGTAIGPALAEMLRRGIVIEQQITKGNKQTYTGYVLVNSHNGDGA